MSIRHNGNVRFLVILALIIVVPALLTSIYKSVFGYYKMEYVGEETYRINTYTTTSGKYVRRNGQYKRRSKTYRVVEFSKEGSETIKISANRSYYNYFEPYNGTSRRVQVYKCVDKDGDLFPVTFMEKNEIKASRECSKLYTPIWYTIWYKATAVLSIGILVMIAVSIIVSGFFNNAKPLTASEQAELDQIDQDIINDFIGVTAEKNKHGQYNNNDLK